MRYYFLLAAMAFCSVSYSQNFILGGGGVGFSGNETLNGVVDRFNEENGHELGGFFTLPGYEIGYARMAKYTVVEVKWGGEGKRNSSKVPGNFIENATVGWRYHYINFNFAARPFKEKYFSAGVGANFGRMRLRYSFGGDFQNTDDNLTISTELFVDYAIKFRWRKSSDPYLFRIRPYYQLFFFSHDLKDLDYGLNNDPDVVANQYLENFGNFGVRFVIMIPLKNKKKSVDSTRYK